MKRSINSAVAIGLLVFAASCAPDGLPTSVVNPASQLSSATSASSNGNGNAFGNSDELNGPADAHIHFARGFENMSRAGFANSARAGGAKPSSPNMTNHGGKIMTSSTVKAIFWGTSWATYSGDKISGINTLYSGFGGSGFMQSVTEYSGSNGTVGTASTYQGSVVDATAASGGGSTSTILAEVCKVIGSTADANGNGYYPVYTDVPRGTAGYCAWHSYGSCSGKAVQIAYFFKLDGDSGCDPGDTSGLHSQGLAALANVSAHELSEAVTDPASPGAWYDGSGAENADKCAWRWGRPLVTLSNNSQWKLQGNWSNSAYTAGTGYANSSGQKGCSDGI